ncbi:MAG: tetratricopeptide repeat protein [Wujia sp.]
MASGLSMTSVNKIKELAESREYSLAVDILDSQDLSKSLNPQFLRLCGVIYTEVGRYVDARRTLLMAHRIAPEAKRVIYSIIFLYLKMGYMDLAKTYYDIYMYDADVNSIDTKQVMYIMAKAEHESLSVLKDFIYYTYSNTMDYDWTYEVILLQLADGKEKEAKILYEEYRATYKSDTNTDKLQSIIEGKSSVEDYLFIFNEQVNADDDPEQEDIRIEEAQLLAADDFRIHPREAEITIMVDDNDEVEIGSKRKLKKYIKEQEKLRKKELQEKEAKEQETQEASTEEDIVEDNIGDDNSGNGSEKHFFKKLFSRNRKLEEESDVSNNDPKVDDNKDIVDDQDTDDKEVDDSQKLDDQDDVSSYDETEEYSDEQDEQSEAETVEESDEDLDMREIHLNQHTHGGKAKISVEFGDDFTAESDSIDGLKDDTDFSNPFDSISALKKDKNESGAKLKTKMDMIFEEAGLSEEESDFESEVDDFTTYPEDEFGEMNSHTDEEILSNDVEDEFNFKEDEFFSKIEAELEEDETLKQEDEVESDIEEKWEADLESEIESESESEEAAGLDTGVELESEYDLETDSDEDEIEVEFEKEYDYVTEDSVSEPKYEAEAEYESEPESEPEAEAEYESEPESEPEAEAEYESEPESEPEAETEYESEPESEPEAETEYKSEPESEPEAEAEYKSEPESESEFESEYETEPESEPEAEAEYESEPETMTEPTFRKDKDIEIPEDDRYKLTGNLDFPVFKSSLFPNHNRNVTEVKNNFSEVMTKAQDKMNENLLREEQMQREAEALLASLGIDLGSVSSTPVSNFEPKKETVSRKELFESLKIDSSKKNILKKLKEYR